MPSKKAKAAPLKPASPPEAGFTPEAPFTPDTGAGVLAQAAAAAQPGQEPDLPPPPPEPPEADRPIPEPAQSPEPGPDAVPYAPIHDLADARALPDVTASVYALATFDSPLAIRAFKDHDGRSMAVVWTGYTLAKAAITD